MGLMLAVRDGLRAWKDARKLRRWEAAGRPVPPPSVAKRQILRDYVRQTGARVFVETGTHQGLTAQALADVCPQVFTIEIEPAKVAAARARFARRPGVRVLEGDSGKVLPQVLAELKEPALFWLDGHYMTDGRSGNPDEHTPISAEIRAVLDHPIRNHVILIDDARLFTGRDDYPSLEALRQTVEQRRPDLHWSVECDIIRLTPK